MIYTSKDAQERVGRNGNKAITTNDLCREYFMEMTRKFKEQKNSKTIHDLYKDVLSQRHYMGRPVNVDDKFTARELAWEIFLLEYVYPYVLEKKKQHDNVAG